jgi:hypothetical protein
MKTAGRVLVYVILGTWLLAMMDWLPIHQSWWNNGHWPEWAGQNFREWSEVRRWTALYFCPPCAAFSENFYFALMIVEAGEDEQNAVHPMPYSGNPLLPDGPKFWWSQGQGREWREVSMIGWYLYWLPPSVLWWVLWGDLFSLRVPWWLRWVSRLKFPFPVQLRARPAEALVQRHPQPEPDGM